MADFYDPKSDMTELQDLLADESWNARQEVPPTILSHLPGLAMAQSGMPALASTPPAAAPAPAAAAAFDVTMKSPQIRQARGDAAQAEAGSQKAYNELTDGFQQARQWVSEESRLRTSGLPPP